MELALAALVLAGVGFLISAYMTFEYYGAIGGSVERGPWTCPSERGMCTTAVSTPEAHVFGVPNSLLGLGWYALIVVAAAARIAYGQWLVLTGLLGVAILAAAFSLYLAWALIFRLRTVCVLCFASQMINLALLGVIAAAV